MTYTVRTPPGGTEKLSVLPSPTKATRAIPLAERASTTRRTKLASVRPAPDRAANDSWR